MNKEDILEISRRENKNKDLAEIEVSTRAGSVAGRVGAGMCCLLSVIFYIATDTMFYSPWVIYFSIIGTTFLVRAVKLKRKTDVILTVLCFAACLCCLLSFVFQLVEVWK